MKHFIVIYKCKWQDTSEPILEEQYVYKILQDPFSITVGSATSGVYSHWLSYRTDVVK